MKIKLTKQQSIIITITTLLLIIGLYFICRKSYKPIPKKTVDYGNNQNYEQALQIWKDRCDFKSGQTYDANYIRDILGRSNTEVYCLDQGRIENTTDPRGGIGLAGWISTTYNGNLNGISKEYMNSNVLQYYYVTGYFDDNWYFAVQGAPEPAYFVNQNTSKMYLLGLGSTLYPDQIKFNTYVDRTPPPNPADYGL